MSGNVYVASQFGSVAAFTREGTLLWTKDVGEFNPTIGICVNPSGDTLYAALTGARVGVLSANGTAVTTQTLPFGPVFGISVAYAPGRPADRVPDSVLISGDDEPVRGSDPIDKDDPSASATVSDTRLARYTSDFGNANAVIYGNENTLPSPDGICILSDGTICLADEVLLSVLLFDI